MSLMNIKDVSFSYDGSEVLSNVSFDINEGDYICIVGENGAGKSTLLKGILGLKKPSSGDIQLGDGLNAKEIGYLPQQTQIQKDFPASVYEVVRSGNLNSLGHRLFYGKKERKHTIEIMDMLGIKELQKSCYRNLSGGQQQRVLLARAMCATHKMLMLDEPVTGLDPVMTSEFYEVLANLNKKHGITIVMISHDIKSVIGYCSHILHLGSTQLFYGSREDYEQSELGSSFIAGDRNS